MVESSISSVEGKVVDESPAKCSMRQRAGVNGRAKDAERNRSMIGMDRPSSDRTRRRRGKRRRQERLRWSLGGEVQPSAGLASGAGGEIRDGFSGGGEGKKGLLGFCCLGGLRRLRRPDKNSEWGRRETGFQLEKGDRVTGQGLT